MTYRLMFFKDFKGLNKESVLPFERSPNEMIRAPTELTVGNGDAGQVFQSILPGGSALKLHWGTARGLDMGNVRIQTGADAESRCSHEFSPFRSFHFQGSISLNSAWVGPLLLER